MSFLNRPQITWIRKAVFQVHLWAGIALGLYVAAVCASGSALVFKSDVVDALQGQSGFWVTLAFRTLHWLGDLHGSLLLGGEGMTANAIGGFLVAALCLTGMVVWWPGSERWKRSLAVRLGVGWKRFTWDLHSALGFWTFTLLLMWGLTGGYFVFPQPFRASVNYFTPIAAPRPAGATAPAPTVVPGQRRPLRPLTLGAKILRGFSNAHYGTFGGWPVKALWPLLGLTPVVLVASSLVMWWNRVLRRWLRRGASTESLVDSAT